MLGKCRDERLFRESDKHLCLRQRCLSLPDYRDVTWDETPPFGANAELRQTKAIFTLSASDSSSICIKRNFFVEDSPNAQPMFGYFPLSVGVANVKNFLDLISTRPAYATNASSGAGVAELANALLLSR